VGVETFRIFIIDDNSVPIAVVGTVDVLRGLFAPLK